MADNIESKAWDWSLVSAESWNEVSEEFLPIALKWKNLGKHAALDLGCGRGRHSLFLAGMGFEVTAVDLSPEGISQLREQARREKLEKNITALVCDMLELPFSPGQFDCVIAFHAIYHTDYRGLKTVVSGITEFLEDSGRLFTTFNSKSSPSFTNPAFEHVDDYTIIKSQGLEKGIPHAYLDYDDILKLLADFRILKIQHIRDFPPRGNGTHYFVEAEKK